MINEIRADSKETNIVPQNENNSKPKKERHFPRNRKKSNNSAHSQSQEKPVSEMKTENSQQDDSAPTVPKPSGKVKLLQKQNNKGASRLFQMATAPLQANFSKGRQKCAANFTEKL